MINYACHQTFVLVEIKIKPDGFTEHKSQFISDYYLGHSLEHEYWYKVNDEADIYRIASEDDIIVISITLVSARYCYLHENENNIINFID